LSKRRRRESSNISMRQIRPTFADSSGICSRSREPSGALSSRSLSLPPHTCHQSIPTHRSGSRLWGSRSLLHRLAHLSPRSRSD
jgi:hypothetical protein